jgi:hypothetical protein
MFGISFIEPMIRIDLNNSCSPKTGIKTSGETYTFNDRISNISQHIWQQITKCTPIEQIDLDLINRNIHEKDKELIQDIYNIYLKYQKRYKDYKVNYF